MSRAIWTSVGVAVVVQVLAVLVGRSFGKDRLLVGWGMGALLRLLAVLVYGFAIIPALGLQMAPALLSLVVILFVTTLFEPFLLTK
ncbi:MAG TPA: hypothetical protein VLI40_02825 [Gemmatimonadaceae bacterium]|jgi:hypothetical protein|nr:hypothetical protein [Gemmatimonadaceae bacterium]